MYGMAICEGDQGLEGGQEGHPTVSYPLFVSDPWLFERAIWIDLATPVTGLGRKKRIYSRLVICLGARVW